MPPEPVSSSSSYRPAISSPTTPPAFSPFTASLSPGQDPPRPSAGQLAQRLVELDADEEDRHGYEQVGGEGEQAGEAADRRPEVHHTRDPPLECEGGEDPRADDEERPGARPAGLRMLGRGDADEQAHGQQEQQDRGDPAPDPEHDLSRAAGARAPGDEQEARDERRAQHDAEPECHEGAAPPRP